MSHTAIQLNNFLHGKDPFTGFDFEKYPDDMTGGEPYPVMEDLVAGLRPNVIVEVGSWKGRSACHFANLMIKHRITDPTIICVDTWLGSDLVHLLCKDVNSDWGMSAPTNHGYPTMYFQFLANMMRYQVHDMIVPFPNTSYTAYRWLKSIDGLVVDMVYIDGCHDADYVYLDIKNYWKLLRPGGVMIGDDFDAGWYGVIVAVTKFANEQNLELFVTAGNKWVLQKPGNS
jgi:hypothetical protein